MPIRTAIWKVAPNPEPLTQLPQFERQVFYFQCRCIEVFTTSLQIRCEQGFAGRGVEARLLDGLWGG